MGKKQHWKQNYQMTQQFPFGVYIWRKKKSLSLKDIYTPMFTVALLTIAKAWKQSKCPSLDEWMKKMSCIHTREYYSAIKSILPFAVRCMNLEDVKLSEISQTQKKKQNKTWSHLFVESKKVGPIEAESRIVVIMCLVLIIGSQRKVCHVSAERVSFLYAYK